MVEQTHPGAARYAAPSRAPVAILTPEERDAQFRGRLLAVFVGALFIPGVFTLAGSVLSPYRLMLLAVFPWLLWRWLVATRPCLVDFLVLASALWMVLALWMNHGNAVLPRSVIAFVEYFGGYLIGRLLITNAREYKRYFVILAVAFAIILPFALIEMVTGFNTLRKISGFIFSIPPRQGNLGPRLGFIRAQGPLEHPILWGLVATVGVANGFYIWRRSLPKALAMSGFFTFVVGTSLSAGPLLSVFAQMCLTAWDRLLFFMRFRWIVLIFLALFGFMLLRILAQFHLLDFVLDNFTFSRGSADGRVVVFDYGMMEVMKHPVFGIGLNDWTRPWYRAGKSSFDNFWLLEAVRYGTPTFGLLALGWIASGLRISTQRTLTPEEQDYRRGYLFAIVGLTITMGTVYIWNATCIFVWMYFGAGAWFYMSKSPEPEQDEETQTRRAAQRRALSGETAPEDRTATPAGARTQDPAAIRGTGRGRGGTGVEGVLV